MQRVMNTSTGIWFDIYLVDEADRILDSEPDLLKLPHDLPTLATIDAARQALKKD